MNDNISPVTGWERLTCQEHGRPFKAQFDSDVFRCGRGCEEVHPEWTDWYGWAVRRDASTQT